MLRVVIYVEGRSDTEALERLLRPPIDSKRAAGNRISFHEGPAGDRKLTRVQQVPLRAANIVPNDAKSIVVALPDLYPPDPGSPNKLRSALSAALADIVEMIFRGTGASGLRCWTRRECRNRAIKNGIAGRRARCFGPYTEFPESV